MITGDTFGFCFLWKFLISVNYKYSISKIAICSNMHFLLFHYLFVCVCKYTYNNVWSSVSLSVLYIPLLLYMFILFTLFSVSASFHLLQYEKTSSKFNYCKKSLLTFPQVPNSIWFIYEEHLSLHKNCTIIFYLVQCVYLDYRTLIFMGSLSKASCAIQLFKRSPFRLLLLYEINPFNMVVFSVKMHPFSWIVGKTGEISRWYGYQLQLEKPYPPSCRC